MLGIAPAALPSDAASMLGIDPMTPGATAMDEGLGRNLGRLLTEDEPFSYKGSVVRASNNAALQIRPLQEKKSNRKSHRRSRRPG